MDEPCYAPTLIPLYRLSEEVSKSYKVALTGDGGDELFGGYQMYYLEKLISPYRRIPRKLRVGFDKISKWRGVPKKLRSLTSRGRIDSSIERYLTWKGIFQQNDMNTFPRDKGYALNYLKEKYDDKEVKSFAEDFMSKDISLWISDHTTNCFDKMSIFELGENSWRCSKRKVYM